ncbi:uncharacterized protein CIMG_08499 [Coccidioides immitis RS]|uniref:Uncharacterized protein n=4 Tax=Coccidioides immitis TaxID=5501 RepID=J3K5M1_COCIM|nr:uncharacterized protein CIMG_08499 [Coccidioides immitis RS]EAS29753.3 hypothetical protein CIMG_08499 [Coccidioides immitis RS]KMP06767.1 hypothetical protein CIRG_06448 [Coccidioides immitis RMSCC 2394]KMU77001.1 hypothetical protein CISG_06236 [Coccidioides immitis RMSCC 3703]KMU90505.1 hypothetical protein CIHG_08394 [Coccidioides immitis H538.4]
MAETGNINDPSYLRIWTESKNLEKYVEASVTPNEVRRVNQVTASKADFA